MATDTDIIDWLENQYDLHRELEITYVVDGYVVEFTYDGNPTDRKRYHGDTLRAALRKAIVAASNAELSCLPAEERDDTYTESASKAEG